METFEQRMSLAKDMLSRAGAVSAFTGAGISTESGISDFRSPGGVWERYRMVTYQELVSSREARREYWKMKCELFREMSGARPNRAHFALAALERAGRLQCLITQNIDGLHEDAGNSPALIIELHGTNRKAVCLSCGRRRPIEEVQKTVEASGFDPRCEACGGLIKPATVSFGQGMPEEEMEKAYRCALGSNLMLMVGSSLQVQPAASIPPAARRAGARMIFINRTETPWDHIAEVVFREDAGDVLARLVEGI